MTSQGCYEISWDIVGRSELLIRRVVYMGRLRHDAFILVIIISVQGLTSILSGAEERVPALQYNTAVCLPQDSKDQCSFLCTWIGSYCWGCGRDDIVERRPEQECGGV